MLTTSILTSLRDLTKVWPATGICSAHESAIGI